MNPCTAPQNGITSFRAILNMGENSLKQANGGWGV